MTTVPLAEPSAGAPLVGAHAESGVSRKTRPVKVLGPHACGRMGLRHSPELAINPLLIRAFFSRDSYYSEPKCQRCTTFDVDLDRWLVDESCAVIR
jgi:hypothetical protein